MTPASVVDTAHPRRYIADCRRRRLGMASAPDRPRWHGGQLSAAPSAGRMASGVTSGTGKKKARIGMHWSRRRLLGSFALGAGALVLAACGGQSTPAPASAPANPAGVDRRAQAQPSRSLRQQHRPQPRPQRHCTGGRSASRGAGGGGPVTLNVIAWNSGSSAEAFKNAMAQINDKFKQKPVKRHRQLRAAGPGRDLDQRPDGAHHRPDRRRHRDLRVRAAGHHQLPARRAVHRPQRPRVHQELRPDQRQALHDLEGQGLADDAGIRRPRRVDERGHAGEVQPQGAHDVRRVEHDV